MRSDKVFSEDDLETFEGWVEYQRFGEITPDLLAKLRASWDDLQRRKQATPTLGRMKLRQGEHRYAVAVEDGAHLWLTLWVRCAPRGDVYVMLPSRMEADGGIAHNPHASYHADGRAHSKSYGMSHGIRHRQPIGPNFRGCEQLGAFYGHAPRTVGAVCKPADFTGVVKVTAGVLALNQGAVAVDLIEPGTELPEHHPWQTITVREVFHEVSPWVVITVGT